MVTALPARPIGTAAAGSAENVPDAPPWNPLARDSTEPVTWVGHGRSLDDPSQILALARTLQRSSARRTLSTLLSFRDWPTYVWLPILTILIFTLPYLLYSSHQTAIHQGYVLSVVAQTSPVYRQVLHLLNKGPMTEIAPLEFAEVDSIEPLDFTGYKVISDDRIYDLRGWNSKDNSVDWAPRMHARFRMRRSEDASGRPELRIQLPSVDEQLSARFLPESLAPAHRRTKLTSGLYLFETALDFSHVPIGSETNVIVDQVLPTNVANQLGGMGRFQFSIAADTGLVRIWVLLPVGRQHDQFELIGFPMGQPDHVEVIDATTTVELPIGAIATFQMINPRNHYRYECRWRWRDQLTVD